MPIQLSSLYREKKAHRRATRTYACILVLDLFQLATLHTIKHTRISRKWLDIFFEIKMAKRTLNTYAVF